MARPLVALVLGASLGGFSSGCGAPTSVKRCGDAASCADAVAAKDATAERAPDGVPDSAPDTEPSVTPDAAAVSNGMPCKGGGECASGFCVDDVCCGAAC